jgi:hypothetical protein
MSTSIANLPKPVGGMCHITDQGRLPLLRLVCEIVLFCLCILANAPFFSYLSPNKVVPPSGTLLKNELGIRVLSAGGKSSFREISGTVGKEGVNSNADDCKKVRIQETTEFVIHGAE